MPIKWSTLKVTQAANDIEMQMVCLKPFVDNLVATVEKAQKLPDLPQYIDQRLGSLMGSLKSFPVHIQQDIESLRKIIPDGALKEETDSLKYGSTEPLF